MRDLLKSQFHDRRTDHIDPPSQVMLYAPLALCGGFFVATILLAAFGPIAWQFPHPGLVYGFLVACAGALTLGYWRGAKLTHRREGASRVTSSAVVLYGSAAYLSLYLPTVHTLTGKWYPDVWTGITDSGAAYDLKIRLAETTSQTWTYLAILSAPLTITLLPVTLLCFRRLSVAAKALGILCITLEVALGVAQAVNKNVAEICAFVVLILILAAIGHLSRRSWRPALGCLAGIVLVVGLFGAYFSATLTNRVEQDVEQATESSTEQGDVPATRVSKQRVEEALSDGALLGIGKLRSDSPVLWAVPDSLTPITVNLTSYLTQGYQGLSLAMEEDFRPTWGLGFSEFYRHNLLRAAGHGSAESGVLERTYSGQIDADYGWEYGLWWSSFFVHPASDITFYGVIVLMALVGFVFGLSWRDTLIRRDPLAATVFLHMCLLVFYLNANNQLFQAGELAVGFTVVLAAWLALRVRSHPAAPAQGDGAEPTPS